MHMHARKRASKHKKQERGMMQKLAFEVTLEVTFELTK
jgi:hypothetical protein